MPIPEETIRRIREATDIVEIVSEYVSLQKRGGANFFGLCPFHEEKSPSFSVHSGRQTFHCFGCGEGGNVYTFLMKIEGIEFPDAVRRLGQRAGIAVDEERDGRRSENEDSYHACDLAAKYYRWRLTDGKEPDVEFARQYLENRGITTELAEKFTIGLAPEGWDELIKVAAKRKMRPETLEKAGLARRGDRGTYYDWFRGRLMFPIFNASGRVVAFGGRILHDDTERPQPKYINTSDTPIFQKGRLLYGLPQARDAMRQEGSAILVEGYTDLISLHSVGVTNTIAGLGTALTHDQATLILRFAKRAILLYDADLAGDMAAFRGADVLVGAGLEVHVALLPPGEDPDTLARKNGEEGVRVVLDASRPLVDFKIDHFRKLGRLNTPQGKSEATRSLLETLRRIQDPITRQFALHEVAEKLSVDERMLSLELDKSSRTSSRVESSSSSSAIQSSKQQDELIRSLLLVLIRNPEYSSSIFSTLHTADLEEHPLRLVFELLEAANIEGESISETELFNKIPDQNIAATLSAILNRHTTVDFDKAEEVARSTSIKLKLMALERDLAQLKDLQKQGQSVMADAARLQQEIMALKDELTDNRLNKTPPA
ncbi:MAG: DNA primase [bacterium]